MDDRTPTRLVTGLDALDMDDLLRRLAHVRANVAGGRIDPNPHAPRGGRRIDVVGRDGTLLELVDRNIDGDRAGVMLRTDPSLALASFTLREPHPSTGPLDLDPSIDGALAVIDRWTALLRLPRTRAWGLQRHGDDPMDAVAERAAALLCAIAPQTQGAHLSVPLRSPYAEPGPVLALVGRRLTPCFEPSVSAAIVASTESTVRLTTEGTDRHSFALQAPGFVATSRGAAPDAVATLRLLADVAHVRRPATAAGLRARG